MVSVTFDLEYPERDNQSVSSSTGELNDDSNASSPALPPIQLSESNQKCNPENNRQNAINRLSPTKRKHDEIEESENVEENGTV